jgi:hypothetical protein
MVETEDSRRAEVIHKQIESIDAEALPWDPAEPIEADCGA